MIKNSFNKGLITDIDDSVVPNEFYIDAHNVRIRKNSGNEFVLTNELNTDSLFTLPDGYVPIGGNSFNGVAFIICAYTGSDPSKRRNGLLGTYPTPNLSSTGYTDAFTPLRNFTIDNVNLPLFQVGACGTAPAVPTTQEFKDVFLNLSCAKVEVELQLSWDDSINMIVASEENPIKIFNTGFNVYTGEKTGQVTSLFDIQHNVNLVNNTDKWLSVNSIEVVNGGQLGYGNYILSFTYNLADFSPVDHFSKSNAISIHNDSDYGFRVSGEDERKLSSKGIKFELTNVDLAFKYINVVLEYYINGQVEYLQLLNPLYIHDYYNSGTGIFSYTVTGREVFMTLEPGAIDAFKPIDAVYAKSITQDMAELYISGLKSQKYHDEKLIELFCKVKVKEEVVSGIDRISNNNSENQSYHSGETYIFHGLPYFKDGTIGQFAYPFTGYDNFNDDYAVENKQGIFRFSGVHVQPYHNSRKYVKFDLSDFTTFWNTVVLVNPAYAWVKDNFAGIVFTRAKRLKNKVYSGLVADCFAAYKKSEYVDDGQSFGAGDISEISKRYAPLLENKVYYAAGYNPMASGQKAAILYHNGLFDIGGIDSPSMISVPGRIGMFSPDFGINHNNLIVEAKYMYKHYVSDTQEHLHNVNPDWANYGGDTCAWNTWNGANASPAPAIPLNGSGYNVKNLKAKVAYQKTSYTENPFTDTYLDITASGVNPFSYEIHGEQSTLGSGFSSRFEMGENPLDRGFWAFIENESRDKYIVNMPFALPSYIGIEYDGPTVPSSGYTEYHRTISALLKMKYTDVDILTWQRPENEMFYPISSPIKLSVLNAISDIVLKSGDCFTQEIKMKIFHATSNFRAGNIFEERIVNQEFIDFSDYKEGYGHWVELVLELENNDAMRSVKGGNKTVYSHPTKEHGCEYDMPESYYYNSGYSVTLPTKAWPGIDIRQAILDYEFSNRVRKSGIQIKGSIYNNYRYFAPALYKDYAFDKGKINKIIAERGQLFLYQDNGISLVPINERATSEGTAGTIFTLGNTQGMPSYSLPLTSFGTQHQWSITKGNAGVFGMDWLRGVLWFQSGNQVVQLQEEGKIRNLVERIKALFSKKGGNNLQLIQDNPMCSQGICSGYNAEENEVMFSFVGADQAFTLVYNDAENIFTTIIDAGMPFILSNNSDTLVVSKDSKSDVHIMDRNTVNGLIFGNRLRAIVKFVVNAISSGADVGKSQDVQYMAQVINMLQTGGEDFNIDYETELQTSTLNFQTAPFWFKPQWRQSAWHLSIPRATGVNPANGFADDNLTGSILHGRYLIVSLSGQNDALIHVKDIITQLTAKGN